jgi:hypothetical protein
MKKHQMMIREDFCPACVTVPFALATSFYKGNSDSPETYRKKKTISLTISLVVTFFAICIGTYFLFIKECSACRM